MQKVRLVCVTIMSILAVSLCLGQQLAKKMSNQDVIDMVTLGLSSDVVIDKIHGSPETDFDTSIDALKSLKAAKVRTKSFDDDQSAPGASGQRRARGSPADQRLRHAAGSRSLHHVERNRDGG